MYDACLSVVRAKQANHFPTITINTIAGRKEGGRAFRSRHDHLALAMSLSHSLVAYERLQLCEKFIFLQCQDLGLKIGCTHKTRPSHVNHVFGFWGGKRGRVKELCVCVRMVSVTVRTRSTRSEESSRLVVEDV